MNSEHIHPGNKVLGRTHDDAVTVGNSLTNRSDAQNPPFAQATLLVGEGASCVEPPDTSNGDWVGKGDGYCNRVKEEATVKSKRPGRGGRLMCNDCRLEKRGLECVLDPSDGRCTRCIQRRRNCSAITYGPEKEAARMRCEGIQNLQRSVSALPRTFSDEIGHPDVTNISSTPINCLLTGSWMATNNVADPNAKRNDEALLILSLLFPSVDASEIEKIVDALARAEMGAQNLAWIHQSAVNLYFPTAIQNSLQSEQPLGYPNEINEPPPYLDYTTEHQQESFSDMLAPSPP